MARIYYYEDDPLKTAESVARYEFARGFAEKGIALDIGCGARKGPFILAESAHDVVGSDVSVKAVSYCARHWRGRNLRYAACDASFLSFGDRAFDAVVAFEVLEHVCEQEKFLKESRRVLKDNGVFVLSTPNKGIMSPDGVPQNPDHVREFTLPELKDFLSGVFGKVELYGQKPSRKVGDVLATRRQSYKNIVRIPVFLRHLFPKAARQALFETYVSVFSKTHRRSRQEDIDERDFSVSRDNVEEAHYLIAVCGK